MSFVPELVGDGFPALDVYKKIDSSAIFLELKDFNNQFFRNNKNDLEYYASTWVADPLAGWSRKWEYIYVLNKLSEVVKQSRASSEARIMDAGSGVTFFPHWIAGINDGVSVKCCDMDAKSIASAQNLKAPASPNVKYHQEDISKIRADAESFDAVFCISVIEHCDNAGEIIEEMRRVLKPGGRLVLTFDISLDDDDTELTMKKAKNLLSILKDFFHEDADYEKLLAGFDESSALTTEYSRKHDPQSLPWKKPAPLKQFKHLIKTGKPLEPTFQYLTCFCWSGTKKQGGARGFTTSG
ncbi:MAG TPA: class I SAM-dependent methyltransferase [bacterium]|nr:class I SAM-dependent methyltransferase [bacterium]